MSDAAFINPDSLATITGGTLFYPAAGRDWSEFLYIFFDHVDTFFFADTSYNFPLGSPFSDESDFDKVSSELKGPRVARVEDRETDGKSHRFLEPARLTEGYERLHDHRRVTIVRRRGFGEYALAEIPDHSVSVFVHRGDSQGDGGSNVFFLANKRRDHEPISNIFQKLSGKLTDRSLIISDGSNVRRSWLRKFHNKRDTSGAAAFDELRDQSFHFGGFGWTCVGYVSQRYGPTLVWETIRREVNGGECSTG